MFAGKKNTNSRSCLLEMEYEEHRQRMSILAVKQETAQMENRMAKRKLEMLEEFHAAKLLQNRTVDIVYDY